VKREQISGIFIDVDRFALLQNIVNKLESCNYQGSEGTLENDVAFIELKEIAKRQLKTPRFIISYAKYPKVGLLKGGLSDGLVRINKILPAYVKWYWLLHVRLISKAVNSLDNLDRYWVNKLKEPIESLSRTINVLEEKNKV
jgi:hypothetical protein